MDIKVNALSIEKALNDEKFKTELIEYLNGVVDEELEKGENMNTDLIEDCTEIIFELENGYEEISIEGEEAQEKIISFAKKKAEAQSKRISFRRMTAIIAIAALLLSATVPAYAGSDETVLEYIINVILSNKDEETNIASIYPEYIGASPPVIRTEDDVDLTQYAFYAVDFDENEFEIPLSEIKVKRETKTFNNQKKILITLTYNGATYVMEFNAED